MAAANLTSAFELRGSPQPGPRASLALLTAALCAAGCSGGGTPTTPEPTESDGLPTATQTQAEGATATQAPEATATATDGGDTTAPATTAPEGTPTASEAGTPTADPGLVVASTFLSSATDGEPLIGAAICQVRPAGGACTESGEKGAVSIGVPPESDVLIRAAVDDYATTLFTVTTGADAISWGTQGGIHPGVAIDSTAAMAAKAGAVGRTLNTSDGVIRVRLIEAAGSEAGTAGQEVDLSPAKGAGPYYTNAGGELKGDLKATSASGYAYWFNVPPGDYTLTVTTKDASCVSSVGAWDGGAADSFLAPVIANRVTWTDIACSTKKTRPAYRQAATPGASEPWGALAEDIAEAWMTRNGPRTMAWNWKEAVLMIGMQATWARTESPEILDYTKEWIDYHMARGYRIASSDTTVPTTSAAFLYDTLGDPAYLGPVEEARAYLADGAPYLDDGTVAHAAFLPNQAWVDSLFMLGSFYTWDARYTGDPDAQSAAALQFERFNEHLFAERKGLYWHMYDEAIDHHVPASPTFWGRGNGWALASLALLLTDLPQDHPDRRALVALFRAHADGVMSYQEPTGLWHTVVNKPETYTETSATALFTFGLLRGYSLGLLDTRALEAGRLGLAALQDQIVEGEDGLPVVTQISKATNPGPYEYYAHVPLGEDEPYGVGAVLLALEEGEGL